MLPALLIAANSNMSLAAGSITALDAPYQTTSADREKLAPFYFY